jgi:GAF domain-containing protein
VPLHSEGRAIGVLNVESFSEFTPAAREHTRAAARLIEQRLSQLGTRAVRDGALRQLSRSAPSIAAATSRPLLADRAVAAAVAVSGLTSAALWWYGLDGAQLGATVGAASRALSQLDPATVGKLFAFADGVTSCHTGGGARDLAASLLGASFESVARAMLVVPMRARGETIGILVATSGGSRDIGSEAVEATELLGLHIAGAHLTL